MAQHKEDWAHGEVTIRCKKMTAEEGRVATDRPKTGRKKAKKKKKERKKKHKRK